MPAKPAKIIATFYTILTGLSVRNLQFCGQLMPPFIHCYTVENTSIKADVLVRLIATTELLLKDPSGLKPETSGLKDVLLSTRALGKPH